MRSPHREKSHLVYSADQLTGVYMAGTLIVNGLTKTYKGQFGTHYKNYIILTSNSYMFNQIPLFPLTTSDYRLKSP